MEPARDERGDGVRPAAPSVRVKAAMEPARDERGDPRQVTSPATQSEPQWSPLAMSGATVTCLPEAASWAGRNGARSR